MGSWLRSHTQKNTDFYLKDSFQSSVLTFEGTAILCTSASPGLLYNSFSCLISVTLKWFKIKIFLHKKNKQKEGYIFF